MTLHYPQVNEYSEESLLKLAEMAKHFVILNDHDKDPEEADMEVLFLLMTLRDIRKRYGLKCNITIEMQKEYNQKLMGHGDHTDFLVSSSMSSLILVQLAENPELLAVFEEILSNEGNELYLKNVRTMGLEGKYTVRYLRSLALNQGYILLGILDEEKNSHFGLSLDEEVTLGGDDNLIILSEN